MHEDRIDYGEPGSDSGLSEDAQAYISEVQERPEEEPPGDTAEEPER